MNTEKKQHIVRVAVRLILTVQLLMLVGVLGAQAQTASDLLKKAAASYEQASGIEAKFTLRARSASTHSGESFEGVIYMKGDKFKLQTPDMITWYDGETQWTYVVRTEEVNVTTPTGEELQFTNPAVLLHNYQKGFDATLKGTSTTRQGKAAYDIELTPKKKSDLRSVVLQIEKNTTFPASIDLETKDGMRHTIVISQWQTSLNLSDDYFVFPEGEYPEAEVVDLR